MVRWEMLVRCSLHALGFSRSKPHDAMIIIKSLDPNKIRIDEKSYKNVFIYDISYLTLNEVKPLYLIVNNAKADFKECHENKYLTKFHTDKSRDTLKKYGKIWSKIRNLIRSTSN